MRSPHRLANANVHDRCRVWCSHTSQCQYSDGCITRTGYVIPTDTSSQRVQGKEALGKEREGGKGKEGDISITTAGGKSLTTIIFPFLAGGILERYCLLCVSLESAVLSGNVRTVWLILLVPKQS